MSWNDDSWKDSYDEWKLRSPYDDGPECDHEEYDIDILDGRCRCSCGHSWYASNEEINAQLELQADYQEEMDLENRRQWWRDLWSKISRVFHLFRQPIKSNDDDIPF